MKDAADVHVGRLGETKSLVIEKMRFFFYVSCWFFFFRCLG